MGTGINAPAICPEPLGNVKEQKVFRVVRHQYPTGVGCGQELLRVRGSPLLSVQRSCRVVTQHLESEGELGAHIRIKVKPGHS